MTDSIRISEILEGSCTPLESALSFCDSLARDRHLTSAERAAFAVFRVNIVSGSIGPVKAIRNLCKVDSILEARAEQAIRQFNARQAEEKRAD